ncbi:hypothetical protein B0I37DRAFT_431444 [Chaetomium sp. MPI-CAGE-AT-0009]|nr:hypothetical protein B0I37DRAFT_431444 [Chaetomium sp. MPI-CAGE-AT-0009]
MSTADGSFMPAAPPPPGVTPNYGNPESRSHELIIVSVVFPVLSFFFFFPRLYSATFIIRKWHTDDYLICIAAASGLANAILCIIQSTMGMGKHIWELDYVTFRETMKIMMLGGAFTYSFTTMFIKLSILSFFLRFSMDRAFRLAVYVVMFISVGYSVPQILLFLYVCTPIGSYWDWTIPGTCINQQAIFDAGNILNMLTDFMILLLPIWMLRPMRVPLVKKLGVMLVLMTGGFVCAVSLLRMVMGKTGENNPDITWHYPVNLIWCLVEEYLGIICACLPSLKAFCKHFYPKLFLFAPDIDERVAASFPFSSFRADTLADGNGNGNGSDLNRGNNNSVPRDGGRRAWWSLRRAGVSSASSVVGHGEGVERGGKGEVDGEGSGEDVEAARGVPDEKAVGGVAAVVENSRAG